MVGFVTFYISFGLITIEFVLHLFSDTAAIIPENTATIYASAEEKTLLLGEDKKKEEPVTNEGKPSKV